jgi:hypothetical protein
MGRRSLPKKRRVGVRDAKKLVVVVCEGSRTEPAYLKSVEKVADKAVVSLRIADTRHTAPKQLVEVACSILKDSRNASRKTGDPNARIDEAWVVCDVDQHPKLQEAVEQATSNGVHMAISNPNFELWLLLHFQDQTAHLERHEAVRRLRSHLPAYAKGKECFEELRGAYRSAKSRSRALDTKHLGDGTEFPNDNPSSGVWRLVDSLGVEY